MTTPVAPLTAEEIAQQRGRHYEIGEDLHDRLLDIAADHARLHAVMNENPARGDMIGEIGPTAAALIISACQAERDELKKRVYTLEAATSLAHRPFGARLDPLSVAHAIAALNEQHAIEIETLRAKLDEAKREVERLREEREALRQRLHDMDATKPKT